MENYVYWSPQQIVASGKYPLSMDQVRHLLLFRHKNCLQNAVRKFGIVELNTGFLDETASAWGEQKWCDVLRLLSESETNLSSIAMIAVTAFKLSIVIERKGKKII